MDASTASSANALAIRNATLRSLYGHFPAIIIAPAAGGLFTTWVLWGHANNTALLWLISLVWVVSVIRIFGMISFNKQATNDHIPKVWDWFAISTALMSGILWGSYAIFIYPDVEPAYQAYVTILLSLVPVAPVAGLATYLPCFYAYYVPATLPFLVVLMSQGTRAGWTSAILLTILMIATLQFARQFHRNLAEAHNLRLQSTTDAKRLAQSLKDRSQFMIDANHDLRQPLQALDLTLGPLNEKNFTPSTR